MPVHDWTRVSAGIFHDFHHSWIEEIKRALNGGILPPDHDAHVERYAGGVGPDVLTLQSEDTGSEVTELEYYVRKQTSVVIRHASDDRVIALIEVVSPGNKASRHALRLFVEKAARVLSQGCHLLVLDLHPPTTRDPNGIHGAIWEEIEDSSYRQPPDKPLTLVAYSAGSLKTAYVEPVAVGDELVVMPLFLEPEAYINVPLEATYQAAWSGVPLRWRRVLTG